MLLFGICIIGPGGPGGPKTSINIRRTLVNLDCSVYIRQTYFDSSVRDQLYIRISVLILDIKTYPC